MGAAVASLFSNRRGPVLLTDREGKQRGRRVGKHQHDRVSRKQRDPFVPAYEKRPPISTMRASILPKIQENPFLGPQKTNAIDLGNETRDQHHPFHLSINVYKPAGMNAATILKEYQVDAVQIVCRATLSLRRKSHLQHNSDVSD